MLKKLTNISRADSLLVAATVVAALRMMLINSQAIGYNVKGWGWFAPAEVISGIAFAVLEGVALAYVSKRWRRFQPVGWTGWGYWVILLLGQLILLAAIVWVTGVAFVATRQNLTIDDVLAPGAALAWSMLVAAINPLIVILIGIVEDDATATDRPTWPPLDTQLSLFVQQLGDATITPDAAARRFNELSGQSVTSRIMASALALRPVAQSSLMSLSAKVNDATVEGVQGGGVQQSPTDTETITMRNKHNAATMQQASDAPKDAPLDTAARRARVRQMAQEGMSQGAIARALGVDRSTVARDLKALQQAAEAVRGNGKVRERVV